MASDIALTVIHEPAQAASPSVDVSPEHEAQPEQEAQQQQAQAWAQAPQRDSVSTAASIHNALHRGLTLFLGDSYEQRDPWAADLLKAVDRRLGSTNNLSATETEACPICMTEDASFAPASSCGHSLCVRCTVQYVRGALGDAQSQVLPLGIRCPLHATGCTAHISPTDVVRLLSRADAKRHADLESGGNDANRKAAPGLAGALLTQLSFVGERVGPMWRATFGGQRGAAALPERHLTLDEVHRLHRFTVEAAIPPSQRAWCPQCTMLVLLPEEHDGRGGARLSRAQRLRAWISGGCNGLSQRRPQDVQCPHCRHRWDVRATRDAAYADQATKAYILATSHACPNRECGQRISHYHGHACHHISPLTNGCPKCHQHFCYVCGRAHGWPGGGYQKHPLCKHGSSYCKTSGILEHLELEPYPHDDRCGCPICPICAPGAPCEQCDGQCVVCVGTVEPGPRALSEAAVLQVMRQVEGGPLRRACKRACGGAAQGALG